MTAVIPSGTNHDHHGYPDTLVTVEQSIRCIEAGAEMVRITMRLPVKKKTSSLSGNELHRRGYRVPLIADIHFTPMPRR